MLLQHGSSSSGKLVACVPNTQHRPPPHPPPNSAILLEFWKTSASAAPPATATTAPVLIESDPPLDVFFIAARGAAPVVETTDDGMTLFWCAVLCAVRCVCRVCCVLCAGWWCAVGVVQRSPLLCMLLLRTAAGRLEQQQMYLAARSIAEPRKLKPQQRIRMRIPRHKPPLTTTQPPPSPSIAPPPCRPPLRSVNVESPGTFLDEYGSLYLRPHQRMLLPLNSPAVAAGEMSQLDGGGGGPGDGSSWCAGVAGSAGGGEKGVVYWLLFLGG